MFIKRSRKRVKGKWYEYAHLVSSYNTHKELSGKLAGMLSGQLSIYGEDASVRKVFESMKPVKAQEAAGATANNRCN
jgi:hypothetical protein